MPRKQDGEFEVLLGNKQLLSIFFIVVILLGVFFTMGYILGRNSSPGQAPAATAGKPAPPPVPPVVQEAQPPALSSGSFSKPEPSPVQTPPLATQQTKPVETAPPTAPQTQAMEEPAAGQTYLQVAAVKQPEAEVVADVLKQKGFRSLIAAHPTEPVFRVLVGPLKDADAIAKTRADLMTAGFKPIVRRY